MWVWAPSSRLADVWQTSVATTTRAATTQAPSTLVILQKEQILGHMIGRTKRFVVAEIGSCWIFEVILEASLYPSAIVQIGTI